MLNKHAPLRKKFLRVNHAPYITKTLRETILHRSQLETKYLKTKTQTDFKLYKKHKNLVSYTKLYKSKLYKRERRKYYEPLDMKNASGSKEFWKTMRPFCLIKTVFLQISIEKNNRMILMILILEFITFFEDVVRSFSVKPDEFYISGMKNLSEPVEIAVRKFENHPSVSAIKQNISVN